MDLERTDNRIGLEGAAEFREHCFAEWVNVGWASRIIALRRLGLRQAQLGEQLNSSAGGFSWERGLQDIFETTFNGGSTGMPRRGYAEIRKSVSGHLILER
jgi:hypothetical protein